MGIQTFDGILLRDDVQPKVEDITYGGIAANNRGIVDLPEYKRFSTEIFEHGQVLYGTGEWSPTTTRCGTPNKIILDHPVTLSLMEGSDPELAYQICFFENDVYQSWSGWKRGADSTITIPANTQFTVTIIRWINQTTEISIDWAVSFLRIDTGYSAMTVSVDKLLSVEQVGLRIKPQLVRGYIDSTTMQRTSGTGDQMSRYMCMYEPVFLYKDSCVYCDSATAYRMRVVKYDENMVGTIVSDNAPIPTRDNAYTIQEDGFYQIHLLKYDPTQKITHDEVFEHVTFNLFSDTTSAIRAIFIGGGKANFQTPGDCTLFIGESGKTILIDCGMDNTEGVILTELRANGCLEPDVIIISHFHSDHFGGLVKILRNNIFSLDGKTLYLPSLAGIEFMITREPFAQHQLSLYNEFMGYVNNATNLTVIRPDVDFGHNIIDGIDVRFWNTDHQQYIDVNDGNYNDYSLCCNMEYGMNRVCMTGDLGLIGMQNNAGKNYKANIMKAQHHGWDNLPSSQFIDMYKWMSTVFPEIVISEDGIAHDTLLHDGMSPMPVWCEDSGVPFYRTNQNGAINIRIDKNTYEIMSFVIRYTNDEYPQE